MATVEYPRKEPQSNAMLFAAIIIIVGVFATTLAQPQVLARIPLQNLLKNELHVGREGNAGFFFWIGFPWYLKPFAGVFTDAFPIFGTRRRAYILISTVLAVVGWIALANAPHQYSTLLWICLFINTFMVIASTVIGGYMVEVAQATSGSGRLTSVRNFVQQVCTLIQGPAGGYLASIPLAVTGYMCGGIMFLVAPITILFLIEQRRKTSSAEVLENAGRQLNNLARAGTMWGAAGLMLLFYLAPGISTGIFYLQQDVLKLNTQQQGFLTFLSGAGGIVAALMYGFVCKKFSLRHLLYVCLFAGTAANIFYLAYNSYSIAQIIDTFNGWGYTLAELALMDLAIRATPKGNEGLGFSLMMSVRNLALFGTDKFGSHLLDQKTVSLAMLIILNTLTTFITIPLVYFLPKRIVDARDSETPEQLLGAEGPRTAENKA
ncbi:MAG: MFS transporter [Armatimonadetes bacterium]|nr:MFS transporter [Armatimonadota bacterium]